MSRKRTIFEPCEKHAAFYAILPNRYRRAEFMCEGGIAGQEPCDCRMKPGTDIFCLSFVDETPVHYAMPRPGSAVAS